jgi:trehalose 6-phosphate phosphatase
MKTHEDGAVEIQGIPGFWDAVRSAAHRCLVLDYDGTIAEFRVDRMCALPLDGVVDLLIQIRDRSETYLAIMTGRPISELLHLLGDLRIPVSGSQGTEFRHPDGTYQTHEPTDAQEERFRRAEWEALQTCPEGRIERKAASVAVHTRGMSPDSARCREDEVRRAWCEDADAFDLECRDFLGGVELRLRGIDKGTALAELLREQPASALCVYVGDDLTDEDAFNAIARRGYGVRVGRPDTPTAARGRLADPAAVKEFLDQWLSITDTS